MFLETRAASSAEIRDLSKYPSDADEAGSDERRRGIGLPSITLR